MNCLFVGAHLDDIELAAAGTIAKLRSEGHAVKMLVLSKSAYTDHDGRLMRGAEEALREGYEAAAILDAELEVLDYPTKDIPYNSEVVTAIERIIRSFDARWVFTHNPHDTHQAHITTANATLSAARYINSIFFYEPFFPSGRAPIAFKPNVYVDITGFLEQKIASLKAHKSQFDKYSEEWVTAVMARAKYRGFENMMQHAESFELARMELRI